MERIKKENKEKILEILEKAGNEEYETSWDDKGIPRSKKKSEYQWKRWGRSDFCWDDAQGGLIWTPGRPIPEVVQD